jgi:hypothetical protein
MENFMDTKLTFQNEDGIECKDLLYSEEYIQKFYSMVMNSNYSVYAICGDWGTGKTCFVKMWENKLTSQEQVFVHIDAFRTDYETEPFLMLIKAFKEFMKKMDVNEDKKNKWLNKARQFFSLRNIAKLGINILADKIIGTEPLKEFINNAYNACFDAVSEEESLYDQLFSSLSDITSQFKTSVYIIIDELDRCRPDFALETLERIKHIFGVKNVKFILVYNEAVMTSMINNKYGSTINAQKYLNKFVEKKYLFNNTKRLRFWFDSEVHNDKERFANSFMAEFLKEYHAPILEMKEMFGLNLRDIRQILSNLKSYENINDVYQFIIILNVEFLKYINKQEFDNMVAYYNANNKRFAGNAPERHTFTIIFNKLADKVPGGMSVSSDEAFYEYARGYLCP